MDQFEPLITPIPENPTALAQVSGMEEDRIIGSLLGIRINLDETASKIPSVNTGTQDIEKSSGANTISSNYQQFIHKLLLASYLPIRTYFRNFPVDSMTGPAESYACLQLSLLIGDPLLE